MSDRSTSSSTRSSRSRTKVQSRTSRKRDKSASRLISVKDLKDYWESKSSESSPERFSDIKIKMDKPPGVSSESADTITREMTNKANTFQAALDQLSTLDANYYSTISKVLKDHSSNLGDWVNCTVAYSGFDAVAMRRKLLRSISSLKDLWYLVAIGLVRGNNTTNIQKTMVSTEARSLFVRVKGNLKIADRVSGNPDAITLSRVIACFPDLATLAIKNPDLPTVVSMEELKKLHIEWPACSRHQVCASNIPDELDDADRIRALDVIMVPYLKTSDIINQKNQNWSRKTKQDKFRTSANYLLNSLTSKVLSDDERRTGSIALGIVVADGARIVLSTTWTGAAVKAKTYLVDKYTLSMSDIIAQ